MDRNSLPMTVHSSHAGFTVLEIIVSTILLGVVLGLVAPLMKHANEQWRRNEARRAALFELSNALERLTEETADWPQGLEQRSLELPEDLKSRFTNPRLVVTRRHLESPPGWQFDGVFGWREPNGRTAAPLRLSAFAFDDAEVTP